MPSKKADAPKQEASEARSPSKRAAELAEEAEAATEGATRKRRKGLGVRVIGGRIYDSENGKTCHQCRQKTIDFMASCKATSGSRACTQHFCAKCLFNRYGEKVTDVAQLPSWSCPRCRGDCNCSICLKKQGRVPTGILAHTAKATGFTSVAELLKNCPAVKADCVEALVSPPEKKSQKKGSTKDETVSAKSSTPGEKSGTPSKISPQKKAQKKGSKTVSAKSSTPGEKSGTPSKISTNRVDSNTKKRKLVITVDGDVEGPVANVLLRMSPAKQKKAPADSTVDVSSPPKKKKVTSNTMPGGSTSNGKKKKTSACKGTLEEFVLVKLKKRVTFGENSELNPVNFTQSDKQVKSEDGQVLPIKPKKAKSEKKSSACTSSEDIKPLASKSNAKASKKGLQEGSKVKVEAESEAMDGEGKLCPKKTVKKKDKSSGLLTLKNCKTEANEPKKRNNLGKTMLSAYEEEIVLPHGEPLAMVAGLDFPSEAVGPAAQLVEFCAAFQSVLGLRRGDAEAMLREVTKSRLVRRGPNSLLVQLHAKLLNMIESSFTESRGQVTQFSSGKKSWLNILKKHLSERSCIFFGLSVEEDNADSTQLNNVRPRASKIIMKDDLKTIKDAIDGGAEGYESLGVYHKLQLLVILCDDSLETRDMRDHIESVNRKYSEAQKENREEVFAARKEVRDARQKIKDAEVAKFLASGNINGPLTIEDQEALLSKVLAETERVVAAASLEKEAVSRMKKGRNDAVRTDAIAWGPDGRAFYKLKGVDNMNSVVVQECKVDQPGLDCWRVYSSKEEDVLTKFLLQRARICRNKMLAEAALEGSHVEGGDAEKENRVPNFASEPVF